MCSGQELLAMEKGFEFPTNICEGLPIKANGVDKQPVTAGKYLEDTGNCHPTLKPTLQRNPT